MNVKTGIGQDSHCFEEEKTSKQLVLGGVILEGEIALKGNSDADVILHALTNAISGITTKPILGKVADDLCGEGITDSTVYLNKALEDLSQIGYELFHISFSLEAAKPKISPYHEKIQENISLLCKLDKSQVALTTTTGEGLTDFGKGLGMQVFCIATVSRIP